MNDLLWFLGSVFHHYEMPQSVKQAMQHQDCIAELEFELKQAKATLGDLILEIQKLPGCSPELQAIIDRYDVHVTRFAKIEGTVTEVVDKVNDWLAQGQDLIALRFYRSDVATNWDRCHEVIGGWSRMTMLEKRDAVQRDLRKKLVTQPPDPALCNPSSSSTPSA
jgi:hypothetical protein